MPNNYKASPRRAQMETQAKQHDAAIGACDRGLLHVTGRVERTGDAIVIDAACRSYASIRCANRLQTPAHAFSTWTLSSVKTAPKQQ